MYTFVILSLLASFFSMSSFASPLEKICSEKIDKLICESGTIDQVNYIGDASFHGTTILGLTKIIGDVEAFQTHFNAIDITGDAQFKEVLVQGNSKITGDLDSNKSEFQQSLELTGDLNANQLTCLGSTHLIGDVNIMQGSFSHPLTLSALNAEFTHSSIQGIDFTPAKKSQSIYLDDTIVNGNILFPSKLGKVYSLNGSTIQGAVIGGTVHLSKKE